MKYKKIIKKFSKAYDVFGHYIFESGRLVTLWEKDHFAHDILRRNLNKLKDAGELIFNEADQTYGAIVTSIPNIGANYIIVLEANKIKSVNNHWKRIRKGIFKALPFEELLTKTSIENKIIELKNQYLENIKMIERAYRNNG